jgi:cysteinyl-tRNA synthetase
LHASLTRHLPSRDWQLVVIDNPVEAAASERIASLECVLHVPLRDHVGFGAGRNLGLRLAGGRILVVCDTSVEVTGDLVEALDVWLADDRVGLVGRWGVVTNNGFDFEPADGDVDGVEAYLMAMRRDVLEGGSCFDPKFRWYRNADLDFSFRVRAEALRTVVDPALPVVRHGHRLWESTPEAEREEASRRNFFRFRDHWASRPDLFTRRR